MISRGFTPHPGCNRHHQDDITCLSGYPDIEPLFATVVENGDHPNDMIQYELLGTSALGRSNPRENADFTLEN